jgi:hypothetical protein
MGNFPYQVLSRPVLVFLLECGLTRALPGGCQGVSMPCSTATKVAPARVATPILR